jgi:hypothetical protein
MNQFLVISCPTKKFVFGIKNIVWMEWDASTKFLKARMDNGDNFELPDVMNIAEMAEVLGVHPNAFKLRLLLDEDYD